jgi:hypothetical protein
MGWCGQALSLANGVKYGLAASIWTRALTSTELSQHPNSSDMETLALGECDADCFLLVAWLVMLLQGVWCGMVSSLLQGWIVVWCG